MFKMCSYALNKIIYIIQNAPLVKDMHTNLKKDELFIQFGNKFVTFKCKFCLLIQSNLLFM